MGSPIPSILKTADILAGIYTKFIAFYLSRAVLGIPTLHITDI